MGESRPGGKGAVKAYCRGLIRAFPPLKKLYDFVGERRKDRLLFHTAPAAYQSGLGEPVREKKVLLVELRLPRLSNSFRCLKEALDADGCYEVQVHLLKDTFVSHREYVRRCVRMMEEAATAKYIFISEANQILSSVPLRSETVLTQLWHGCGAFKRFGHSTEALRFGGSAAQQARHPMYGNYSYVTVSSPEVVWAYAQAMGLEGRKEIIRPVGISRTDWFFRPEERKGARERLLSRFPAAKGKKIILYAPTFRGQAGSAAAPDRFDPAAFARALGEGYAVIIKHHPLVKSLPTLPEHLRGSFVYDATRTMEIEDLLAVSDVCISDYSSLIFEYALLERPMLFFSYDLEEYFDWRGFYYPYEELTPGPVCRTNEELIDEIRKLETHFDPGRLRAFKERFMSACDGHATERIMKLVFGPPAEDGE